MIPKLKSRFLEILEIQKKYYRGDSNFTKKLYRKFLTIVKERKIDKPYKFQIRFIFPHSSARAKMFYIERGWSEEETKKFIKAFQGRGFDYYKDRSKVDERSQKCRDSMSKKTLEEITEINRKKKNGRCIEFLMKKYSFTQEQATEHLKRLDMSRVEKHKNYLKTIGGYKKEWSCRCLEYWIKKCNGDIEEAKKRYKESQDTRSITSIMKNHGCDIDTAKKIQEQVTSRWLSTLDNKTPEEKKEILLRKMRKFKFYSNASKKFFEKILGKLDVVVDVFYGDNEYFLWNNDSSKPRLFFYDFTIRPLKIIIEYNGILYHPRDKDNMFLTVEESLQKDNLKIKTAKDNGYDVFVVWENENLDKKVIELVDIINKKIQYLTNENRSNN